MSGLGGKTCRRCGRSGASRTNILGEAVCDRCWQTQTGLAAGMIQGNGQVAPAIATAGILAWIRRALGRPRSEG